MFSGRPCVRPSVRASVIHVVVLCFRDISSICWRIFAKLLSLVHLGTQMTWLRFWAKRSKFKVTIAAEAHSTRRYRRVQLFLVSCCCLPFHIISTEHSIITQAASQWVCASLAAFRLYWLFVIDCFFVLFSENKYDDDDIRSPKPKNANCI